MEVYTLVLVVMTFRAVTAIVRYYNEKAYDNKPITGEPVITIAPKPNGVSG